MYLISSSKEATCFLPVRTHVFHIPSRIPRLRLSRTWRGRNGPPKSLSRTKSGQTPINNTDTLATVNGSESNESENTSLKYSTQHDIFLHKHPRTRTASGQLCKAFGIKISPNAQVVQIARNAGFDSLFIDLEHAWLTLAEASNLCKVGHLCGITPFVRVPRQCGNGYVQRVLDGGAMGVVFPHTHNADDAKAAVKISKYPPLGCRSMTGQMPIFGMRGMSVDQTIEFCNQSGSTVFAMIESRDAVERADEIAAVEGVDVVLVGSMDLTIDLGIGGQFDKPEYRSSLEKISQACRDHGKVFGVAGVYDNPALQDWIINGLGARFMLVQQDLSLLSSGGVKAVKALPDVN